MVTGVLITRPEPDASRFADLCRQHGFNPVVCPLMRVRAGGSEIDLAGVGALAFTSANGVRVFSAANPARQLPVFAVGETTATEARRHGFRRVNAAGGDVAQLAALISKHRNHFKGSVLHAAGSRRAGDLAAALEMEKISCRRVVLYEIEEKERMPEHAVGALTGANPVRWTTFFSPRSAALFARLSQDAAIDHRFGQINAACLSDAVARELSSLSFGAVKIARQTTAEAMIELMRDA